MMGSGFYFFILFREQDMIGFEISSRFGTLFPFLISITTQLNTTYSNWSYEKQINFDVFQHNIIVFRINKNCTFLILLTAAIVFWHFCPFLHNIPNCQQLIKIFDKSSAVSSTFPDVPPREPILPRDWTLIETCSNTCLQGKYFVII